MARGIRIYKTSDLSLVVEDKNYGNYSLDASFSPDSRLVTSSFDGYLRLYSRDFQLLAKKKAPGADNLYRSASLRTAGPSPWDLAIQRKWMSFPRWTFPISTRRIRRGSIKEVLAVFPGRPMDGSSMPGAYITMTKFPYFCLGRRRTGQAYKSPRGF